VPIVLKSGSLNLLEPSGLVEACNGLPFPLPVVIWSTGTISFSFRQHLSNILGKQDLKGLQQTATLDTAAHILREVKKKNQKDKAIPLQARYAPEGG